VNKTNVKTLLKQWSGLIDVNEQLSKEKASQNTDGLRGRIKRTIGTPIVFDLKTHKDQQKIQNALCQELPQYIDLIHSKPDIMDGHPWIREDFIELYAGHFRIVVEKLERVGGETVKVQ
jgi:hypothetical protein